MTDTASPPTGLSAEQMASHLRERLEDAVVDHGVEHGQLTVTVTPGALVRAARLCRDDPALAMDFWEFNCGVDLGEEGFAVVTGLYSTRHRHRVFLRVVAPGGRDEPKVPTLTEVYRGADWSEREAYDMFGIAFEGHPGLEPRILTAENFEGWPLRKDFLLSTRQAKPWPGAKEPEERSAGEEPTSGPTAASAPVSAEEKAAAAKAKAERAKAKAAEMRAKKAAEKAAAQMASADEAQTAGEAEPDRADARADAVEQSGGGQTEGLAAAQAAAAAGEPEPQTPEGAADLAGTDVAKDAAAGAVGGDTAAGAPQDRPGADEPVVDPRAEAEMAEGAPAAPAATPGVEVEGRHGGADEQSGRRPAGETIGMDAEQMGGAARAARETPAPEVDEAPPRAEDDPREGETP